MDAPVWLIAISAGQTWRFGTRRVEYGGNVYEDGLDTTGDFLDALSFSVPDDRSLPITINAQGVPDFDTEDISRGATAVVYYWADSGTGDPVIVISGRLQDPEFGGPDEVLTASVTEVPWDDRGSIIPDLAVVNLTSWVAAHRSVHGERYPLVIGSPGLTSSGGWGSPIMTINEATSIGLLSIGHVTASFVTVRYDAILGAPALAVSHGFDYFGIPVSTVDCSGLTGWAAGDEIWALWDQGGGGIPNPDLPTSTLTGAGDVIEYLLHLSTIRVDWGRLRSAKRVLNAYKIDAYIQPDPEKGIRPWDWISSHLLPLLPVSVRVGPLGLYLAVFDPSTPSRPVAELEEGRNCDRVSPVSTLGTDGVVNDLSLSYALDGRDSRPTQTARVSADVSTLADFSGVVESAACRESQRRFGRVRYEGSTSVVWEHATAVRVLRARASRSALPPLSVVYVLDDDAALNALEPGDQVTITDSVLGWSGVVAHVWSVRAGDPREVTVRIWRVPGRDYSAP